MNKADTCRTLVRPKFEAAGWDGGKHFFSEQTPFTNGRIIVPSGKSRRLKKKFSDFLLRFTRDITPALVEAKSDKRSAGDGIQKAKDYANILGLKFAYSTNGTDIIEYDYFTCLEQLVERFPTPDEFWSRYQIGQGFNQAVANALLVPFFHQPGKEARYYQKIAILRSVEAILNGQKRCLLTMATGTGKTLVAFQICWKLWASGWNAKGEIRNLASCSWRTETSWSMTPRTVSSKASPTASLAPYCVHRILTTYDAAGWRPNKGQKDVHDRDIPDAEYHTKDFERTGGVSLLARTQAIAKHITDFLKKTDRFANTIVFCVDQEHADQMRRELNNLNADLVQQLKKQGEEYVTRVTSDEGYIGRGFLSKFQDPEERAPVILTTSQLLTTGVDAPTCQNVVLIRVIGSMTEFKQIIGRGTRVRDDKGKLFFNILDYTGSATRLFADPEFDGDPSFVSSEEINKKDETVDGKEVVEEPKKPQLEEHEKGEPDFNDEPAQPRNFYVRGGLVDIDTEVTYDLNADGSKLRTVQITQYAAETARTLYTDPDDLRKKWSDFEQRSAVIEMLEQKGIDFNELAASARTPDADPFDLLCHLAYNAPLLTRK